MRSTGTGPATTLGPWDPLSRLRGVGPRTAELLAAAGLERVLDLALLLPRRYEDLSTIVRVADCAALEGRRVLACGELLGVRSLRSRRRGLGLVTGAIVDDSGRLPVVWFNRPWVLRAAEGDGLRSAYGVVRRDPRGRLQLVNPELRRLAGDGSDEAVVPVYPRVAGVPPGRLRALVVQALEAVRDLEDPLPRDLTERFGAPGLADSLVNLHRPPALPVERWRRRLACDELVQLRGRVVLDGRRRCGETAPRCPAASPAAEWAERGFGFALTSAQRRALAEIAVELGGTRPMARLLQGDVGCGKTAVAAAALLGVVSSGRQAAVMAPTELLAEQHRRSLDRLLGPVGVVPELLTSSSPTAERRRIEAGLASGGIGLVVGTHALIQESIRFRDLGLAVIDEQHRFGVLQRQALVDKGPSPHLLVMTATPIPRSLALTLYGGLDVTVIDELPPGRQVVRTAIRDAGARPGVLEFVRREVEQGGRAYIVFPVIDPAEELDAPALSEHEGALRDALQGVAVGVLHGRLSGAERAEVERGFRDGAIQVLLATTVIEVGIDVPEASVMVIEGADRFGLSQLHQLRGRVGRGTRASWCVLITDGEPTPESRRRLERFRTTNDGFELAEADLELRGAGELAGTRQWGMTGLRFADLLRDRDLIEPVRAAVERLEGEGSLAAVLDRLGRLYGRAVAPLAG